MSEDSKKGGAGKFFLGALLGGIAGAIAGRFVSVKAEEIAEGEECDDGACPCEKKCSCEDKKEIAKEEVKKAKKTAEKK